jgi:hypothetical protein
MNRPVTLSISEPFGFRRNAATPLLREVAASYG